MCTWTPGEDSPDRMDALVWALTELMTGSREYKAPGTAQY
jgi:phage terminase large subunit-like protein